MSMKHKMPQAPVMDDDDQNEDSLGSYVSEAEQACWLAGVAQIPVLAASRC